MTRNTVAKFGGTSVKTASAIRQIGHILTSNPSIRVVVVSAVAGVTNLLVELCKTPKGIRASLIQQIQNIHLDLAQQLNLPIQDQITQTILYLNNIQDFSSPQVMDYALSYGEDLSSLILHAYLASQGLEVTHVDIRNFLTTNDHFGKAIVDLAATKRKMDHFPLGLCVTQGFIGCTSDGQTTTLGRGGSDYSAALLAESLNADELLIYTDVPGVYTMDPRIVPSAHLIPELSFQEMAEMANFGAKILHPATLEPCIRAQIPVRILSTFEPNKPGTLVTVAERQNNIPTISAITMRQGQLLVTIKSLKMLDAYGFLASIFGVLARNKISVDLITTSEVSVALTIDSTSIGSHAVNPFTNQALLDELTEFAEVIIEEDLTLLAIVGTSLTIPGIIQKTLKVIESYPIRLVCYGASNSSISILVHKDKAITMVQMLHQQLLGNSGV
jgi:aspartate kinase